MKILIFLVVLVFAINVVSAVPYVQLNTTTNYTTSSSYPIVAMIDNVSRQNVNSSDYWDNLDTPLDITQNGMWTRTGTTLEPTNSGDDVTVTGVGTFGATDQTIVGQTNLAMEFISAAHQISFADSVNNIGAYFTDGSRYIQAIELAVGMQGFTVIDNFAFQLLTNNFAGNFTDGTNYVHLANTTDSIGANGNITTTEWLRGKLNWSYIQNAPVEDLWNRTGTTLTPKFEDDNINTTGNVGIGTNGKSLQLYSNGNDGRIDTLDDIIFIPGGKFGIGDAAFTPQERFHILDSGDGARFEIEATGVTKSAVQKLTTTTGSYGWFTRGTSDSSGYWDYTLNNGVIEVTSNTLFELPYDNQVLQLGTGSGYKIYKDSAGDSYHVTAGQDVIFKNSLSGDGMIFAISDVAQSSTTHSFRGKGGSGDSLVINSAGDLFFNFDYGGDVNIRKDNKKFIWGAGVDLEIYSDGTDGVLASPNDIRVLADSLQLRKDNQPLYLGAVDDSYLNFDGDSLNIGGNKTTATDDINIIADDVNVLTNLNQTQGNATINNIYGEMYGVHSGEIYVTEDNYQNISNLTAGYNNGFVFDGNYTLTVVYSGVYKVTSDFAFSGTANNEYHLSFAINNARQSKCHTERVIGTGGDVGSAGVTCLVELNVGDYVAMQIENVDSSGNPTIHDINLNLVRVGNL